MNFYSHSASAQAPVISPWLNQNMVQNPSFEDSFVNSWFFKVTPGANATLAADNTTAEDGTNSAVVTITQSNTNRWYVQLAQILMPIFKDRTYELTFWAKASAPRNIEFSLQQSKAPYPVFKAQAAALTTSWQQYTMTYTSSVNQDNTSIHFNLAESIGTVWIDNVSLKMTNTPELHDALAVQPSSNAPGLWNLVFNDEFDGTTLDVAKWVQCRRWNNYDGCHVGGTEELQWYSRDNVIVNNGTLKLRALKQGFDGSDGQHYDYTSGMITTDKDNYNENVPPRFSYTYGYAEMKAKLPPGQGYWPAFWMLQQNGVWPPEIDILENLGHQMTIAHMTFHWSDLVDGSHKQSGTICTSSDLSANWHTYGVDWQPNAIVWYLDGQECKRYSTAANIPTNPMYLLLNLSVGGAWGGYPDSTTVFPGDFETDYVRVWQKEPSPTVTPTVTITNTPTPTSTKTPTSTYYSGGGSVWYTQTPTRTPEHFSQETIPDEAKAIKKFYAYRYSAKWAGQYQASTFEGTANNGDEYFDMQPCSVLNFWAELQNDGITPWLSSKNAQANSLNEFTFATYKDPKVVSAPSSLGYDDCPLGLSCGKSYFKHSSWVSDYRIGTLDQLVVYPGQIGRVSMQFQIPCNAEKGRYREDISAASGKYWIYNGTNGDPLNVMHIWVGFRVQ
ncbi:MAG: family 16 glycosylhydrolase [bacterium]